MDNQKLAELLFPEVVNTPEYYEEKFPYRKLPNKAEVTRMAPSPTGFIHLVTFIVHLPMKELHIGMGACSILE